MQYFREADVFVLPSVAAEGIPRVIQEAMASCCPVVATDIGSARYQLGMGQYGAVVPPNNPQALTAAIARLIDDSDYRRSTIANAFERARKYTYERQHEYIGEILRENVDPALLRAPDR